ncbi:hypothetical protein BJ508DRAFT_366135 [Ascobolus immersus RN42]|uniref:Disintegrin domain-containing protein n=1 Tax=Ascobolus immersus RN42 TaxID=1160509 RepID=A0A3N4HLG6_ASCIM|nr:hypothetical protein BJ508DRAFT_366135 [Ascobolus immersus RN42]
MSTCGNGIVEPEEDCDCGDNCDQNSCCDTNCKFKDKAVCDHNDPLNVCCESCQFRAEQFDSSLQGPNSKLICRGEVFSENKCIVPDYCTFGSATCPNGYSASLNGEYCGPGSSPGAVGEGLYCAYGVCTSRSEQCKTGAIGKVLLEKAEEKYGSMNGTGGIMVHGFCSDTVIPGRSEKEKKANACRPNCIVGGPNDGDWWDCLAVDGIEFRDGTLCDIDGETGTCSTGECVISKTGFRSNDDSFVHGRHGTSRPLWIIAPVVILSFVVSIILYFIISSHKKTKKMKKQIAVETEEERRRVELEGAFAPTVVWRAVPREKDAEPVVGGEAFAPRQHDVDCRALAVAPFASTGVVVARVSSDSSIDENFGKTVDGQPIHDAGGASKGKAKVVETGEATVGESTAVKPETPSKKAGERSSTVTHTGRYF